MAHIPVLQKEVMECLNPKPNENFIDCTIGEGGHSMAILERTAPRGKVLGIDRQLRLKQKERLILTENNFANLKDIVEEYRFRPVNGIFFDLGMSSWHLEDSGRGFSFRKKEPLDMRYDAKEGLTAEKIVNYWSRAEIERILLEYGEERKARRIAELIAAVRKTKPVVNTLQLRAIVEKSGGNLAQTFQALRIAVNGELKNLEKALPQAAEILEEGGRLAVISFHSLEDRIVKNFFSAKGGSAEGGKNTLFTLLTKKPIVPGREEVRNNPRSASAKLRAVKKIIQ